MRSLSQSAGKPPWIVERLVAKWQKICIFCPIVALIYMAVIVHPDYNERTRISENALLSALVTERFTNHQLIFNFLKDLRFERDRLSYITSKLGYYGIATQTQAFVTNLPNFNKSGVNVIGTVRATRTASVEGILVAVSINGDDLEAVAVALALAAYCREQIYWARDIIFTFVDKGTVGMTAFLDAYFGIERQHLTKDAIRFHSGAIVGAFALKTSGSQFDSLDIEYNMVNGLLPNLDLINLMVRLSEKFVLYPTIFNQSSQVNWWDFVNTTQKAIINQAFGNSEGLHSVFGLYGIQALTINAKNLGNGHSTLADFTRLCEGALRSLNNILEKFHQSYFLYILPDTRHFISVAFYMPALGLLLSPLLILALRDWFALKQFQINISYVLFHAIGIIEYVIARRIAQSICFCQYNLYYFCVLFIPYYLFFPLDRAEVLSTNFLFYLECALVFGAISLLNFSLAFIVSLFTVPLIVLLALMNNSRRSFTGAKPFIGYLFHPISVLLVFRMITFGEDVEVIAKNALQTVNELIRLHFLHDSWLYPMLFICFVPIWSLFMQLSSNYRAFEQQSETG